MDLKQKLAALADEAADLARKAQETPNEFTADDLARAETVAKEHAATKSMIERQEVAAKALASITVLEPEQPVDDTPTGTLGEQFIASKAMSDFRATHPGGVPSRTPIAISAKANMYASKAAVLGTVASGARKQPEFTDDLTYRPKRTLLDMIYVGTTDKSYFPYRQITSFTQGAKVVTEASQNDGTGVEQGVKPLSTMTTTTADAKVATYADGMEVTNQELEDDGALIGVIDGLLTDNLRAEMERVILNGSGTGDEPAGLLTTSGVLQQAWDTDPLTTLRKAKTKLLTRGANITGLVLNPEDEELIDLLKGSDGHFLGAGPFAQTDPTVWAMVRATSTAVPKGQALAGNLQSIQLLMRSPITIEAFNQHKDYAARNIAYLRAETRAMQLFRAPGHLCLIDLEA